MTARFNEQGYTYSLTDFEDGMPEHLFRWGNFPSVPLLQWLADRWGLGSPEEAFNEAVRRRPCGRCGCRSVRLDVWLCDRCFMRATVVWLRREERLRWLTSGAGRPLEAGRQPDGAGCVERVHPLELAR